MSRQVYFAQDPISRADIGLARWEVEMLPADPSLRDAGTSIVLVTTG